MNPIRGVREVHAAHGMARGAAELGDGADLCTVFVLNRDDAAEQPEYDCAPHERRIRVHVPRIVD